MIIPRTWCFHSAGRVPLMFCALILSVGTIAGCPGSGAPNNNDPNDNQPNDNMPDDNDPDDSDDTKVAIGHLAALAKDGSGGFYAVDVNNDTVIRIDGTTGGATLVSGKGRGSGPEMNAPNNIFRESDGRLLIITVGRLIYRVDPGNGNRTLLVDLSDPADPFPNGISGILATADGTLFISQLSDRPRVAQLDVNTAGLTPVTIGVLLSVDDFIPAGGATALAAGGQAIVKIQLPAGTTTVVSNKTQGQGSEFGQLRALAVADNGTIYAGDEANSFFGLGDSVVFRVDPVTGDRTVVSGPNNGSGPQLRRPRRMVVVGNDRIVMLDEDLDGLLIINAQTGERTLLTVQ